MAEGPILIARAADPFPRALVLQHRLESEVPNARAALGRAAAVARDLADRLERLEAREETQALPLREDVMTILLHGAREVRWAAVNITDVLEAGMRSASVVLEARGELAGLAAAKERS